MRSTDLITRNGEIQRFRFLGMIVDSRPQRRGGGRGGSQKVFVIIAWRYLFDIYYVCANVVSILFLYF